MKDLITIIIPCKNEKDIIFKTLDLLNYQNDIHNVKVIVADCSDDNITNFKLLQRIEDKTDLFDLSIIEGGLPAKARNNGYKLTTTPYVLFIDADIFMSENDIIQTALELTQKKNLDLVTVKFRSDDGNYNYVYKAFDIIQFLSKWSTPFCLGGFMLFNSLKFKQLNGFDETIKIAEDYNISKMIKPSKFGKINKKVLTPSRRFKNKGIIYMTKLMVCSFLYRNDKKWFKEDKNYWNEKN
jgi:glycosyltransferase involved in cell wall biosynthesis